MENILKIFQLAVGASFVQRTRGFGFGIFVTFIIISAAAICINVGGYIGESTRGEIAYAKSQGITVLWAPYTVMVNFINFPFHEILTKASLQCSNRWCFLFIFVSLDYD
ncbi:MAG: hypothetical protein SPG52_02340 [Candidatus Cryptobacteroides sp.]|nr:hypothetical protein [Candidatus Cryptobacteroides sp.]